MATSCLHLDRTWNTPAENLAADEALLEWCQDHTDVEVLRLWESATSFVVLGRSNTAAEEADLAACADLDLPVLRRCSGGGTVLQGPGCLNFALILQASHHQQLATVTATNQWIMESHRDLLTPLLGSPVQVAGITDLALDDAKFSGNAQKRSRDQVLFHGTFLLSLDLSLLDRILRHPRREPAYRAGRPHHHFVRNLPIPADTLRENLRRHWRADTDFDGCLEPYFTTLLKQRYLQESWHHKL